MSRYERIAGPIRTLANNPDINVLTQQMTNGTQGIHGVAPNIGQSLQTVGSRALTYLHSKMPKPFQEHIGDAEYEPSKSEQRQWLHLHDMVDDPISILDHVRHGTVTGEQMDALQQVHPELLDHMRQKVMENMEPAQVRKLPTTTKLSLSSFLGSPISESSTPEAILANQASFQMSSSSPQPGSSSPKSTVGGMKELKVGQRAETETMDLEAEK